jgi:hypothetical protein
MGGSGYTDREIQMMFGSPSLPILKAKFKVHLYSLNLAPYDALELSSLHFLPRGRDKSIAWSHLYSQKR